MGIDDAKLNINSIGCPVCRKEYNEKLRAYFESYRGELCGTCLDRLEKNPMRIIDCKSEVCSKIAENAPKIIDYLCDECKEHFEDTKAALDIMGIAYTINPDIVRGLDYYTKTVFEFTSDCLGAQSTVCGGGRYSGLVEELGGKPAEGIGFATGLERLILILKNKGIEVVSEEVPDLFVAAMGKEAEQFALKLIYDLRNMGIHAEQDLCGRSLKAQMKYADKLSAKYSIVIGDNEIAEGKAQLKNMNTGDAVETELSAVSLAKVIQEV